jgi:homoserine/homoserine lactone efflux protein
VIDTVFVVLPLMLSPGPANLVSFVLGTRNGALQLLPFQLGILLVYAVVAVVLGLLSNRIYAMAPAAVAILQAIGGLFIIYLGIQLARRTQHDTIDNAPTFANGVALQCLNPKFPGVVLAVFANRHTQPIVIVAATIFIVGAIGLLAYSTAGSILRTRGLSDSGFRTFDFVAGGMLCAVGLWFILQPLLAARMEM